MHLNACEMTDNGWLYQFLLVGFQTARSVYKGGIFYGRKVKAFWSLLLEKHSDSSLCVPVVYLLTKRMTSLCTRIVFNGCV